MIWPPMPAKQPFAHAELGIWNLQCDLNCLSANAISLVIMSQKNSHCEFVLGQKMKWAQNAL